MAILSGIRQSVKTYLFNEAPNETWTNEEIDNYINEGHKTIVHSLVDNVLFALQQESYITADGASVSYQLPDDFLRAYSLEDNSGNSYHFIPIQTLLKRDEILSLKETYIFSVWNKGIYVYTPTGIVANNVLLHLFFIKIPKTLLLDADVSDLSEDLIRLVVYYAVSQALPKAPKADWKKYYDLLWNEVGVINSRFMMEGKKK